jgi:hypothetical protein
MMAISDEEKVELLEDVLAKMDEIAENLRRLDDPEIQYRCLADFEGREGGWLGEFARDILERKLRAYREGGEDDED